MDAITAITNDHRELETLFDRLKTGQGDRAQLVTEVKARLTAHSVAEEEHVYPALARKDPAEADEVHHGVEEHREAEEKLAAVEAAVEDPNFDAVLAEFVDAVKHHVEEEESELLPALEEAVSTNQLEELGKTFEQRRVEELKGFGIGETATKQELYEQAKQAGISGRSTMTKDELAEAVREQDVSAT